MIPEYILGPVGVGVGVDVGVGVAVTVGVKATFTDKETGEKIVRSCRITVKRNAVDAGISPNSENKLLNLTVGDSFQTKAYRTDSDGVQSWSGRDKITDGVRFLSSNPEVFTVGKTKGIFYRPIVRTAYFPCTGPGIKKEGGNLLIASFFLTQQNKT